jgi:hypothetical protein
MCTFGVENSWLVAGYCCSMSKSYFVSVLRHKILHSLPSFFHRSSLGISSSRYCYLTPPATHGFGWYSESVTTANTDCGLLNSRPVLRHGVSNSAAIGLTLKQIGDPDYKW